MRINSDWLEYQFYCLWSLRAFEGDGDLFSCCLGTHWNLIQVSDSKVILSFLLYQITVYQAMGLAHHCHQYRWMLLSSAIIDRSHYLISVVTRLSFETARDIPPYHLSDIALLHVPSLPEWISSRVSDNLSNPYLTQQHLDTAEMHCLTDIHSILHWSNDQEICFVQMGKLRRCCCQIFFTSDNRPYHCPGLQQISSTKLGQ